MSIEKTDNSKLFLKVPQPLKPEVTQQNQTQTVPDGEKTRTAKYMIGATAIAITVAAGIIGHKNNWWRGSKNISSTSHTEIKPQSVKSESSSASTGHVTEKASASSAKEPENISIPKREDIDNASVSTAGSEKSKQSKLSKLIDTITAPFRKIKEHRESKRLKKEAAQKAKKEALYKEQLEVQKQRDANMRQSYAEARQKIIDDEPNRLERIAKQEKKYAAQVKRFSNKDFGNIDSEHVLEDYDYAKVKPYLQTNPELFVPSPKRGEYNLSNFAVDGYWNGPSGMGASCGANITGTELRYNNQFTLHDTGYPQLCRKKLSSEQLIDLHWAMQKVAVKGPYAGDKRYHIGTALRFSAPECANDRSRPLGWNIFIEGDISLAKMNEIKKHLVESGVWARQMAIQSDDTMIEVLNEIIKCLNK